MAPGSSPLSLGRGPLRHPFSTATDPLKARAAIRRSFRP
jgi:hypothetical protein